MDKLRNGLIKQYYTAKSAPKWRDFVDDFINKWGSFEKLYPAIPALRASHSLDPRINRDYLKSNQTSTATTTTASNNNQM